MSGKTGGTGIPAGARIVAWALAFCLAALMAVTAIGIISKRELGSGGVWDRIATDENVLAEEMDWIQAELKDLAIRKGLEADQLATLVTREDLIARNRVAMDWWRTLVDQGIVGSMPVWDTAETAEKLEALFDLESAEDPELLEALETEICGAIEDLVHQAAMPVRDDLAAAAMKKLRKRIDLYGILTEIRKTPLLLAGCIALAAGGIALLMARRIRETLRLYGAAIGGAGIATLAGLAALKTLNAPAMMAEGNRRLATQWGVLEAALGRDALIAAAGMLALGALLLWLYGRKVSDGKNQDDS